MPPGLSGSRMAEISHQIILQMDKIFFIFCYWKRPEKTTGQTTFNKTAIAEMISALRVSAFCSGETSQHLQVVLPQWSILVYGLKQGWKFPSVCRSGPTKNVTDRLEGPTGRSQWTDIICEQNWEIPLVPHYCYPIAASWVPRIPQNVLQVLFLDSAWLKMNEMKPIIVDLNQ